MTRARSAQEAQLLQHGHHLLARRRAVATPAAAGTSSSLRPIAAIAALHGIGLHSTKLHRDAAAAASGAACAPRRSRPSRTARRSAPSRPAPRWRPPTSRRGRRSPSPPRSSDRRRSAAGSPRAQLPTMSVIWTRLPDASLMPTMLRICASRSTVADVDVHAGAPRDVVEDDRQAGALGDRLEVLIHALPASACCSRASRDSRPSAPTFSMSRDSSIASRVS